MTTYATFQVSKYPISRKPVVSEEVFDGIHKLAFQFGFTTRPLARKGDVLPIRAPISHPGLEPVLKLIRSEGWEESYIYPQHAPGRYSIILRRDYSDADLDSCEYLYLAPTWADWPLTGFAGRSGRRWIGNARDVGSRSGEGWRQQVGSIDGLYNYFAAPEVIECLASHGIRGLQVHSLLWDEPHLAEHDYFEIDSDYVMPDCLLPMFEESGASLYREGSYYPAELHFLRKDVLGMGEFDIAKGRERIGDPSKPNCGESVFVISNKLRRVLLGLGLSRAIKMFPVRLD